MSHRKVHSQGSIPFSWESSPGISKFSQKNLQIQESKIPPPPGMVRPPPARSALVRASQWIKQDAYGEEDPFVAAYRECTKGSGSIEVSAGDRCRGVKNHDDVGKKNGSLMRRKKGLSSVFSCRSSCDVLENSFVRLPSNVPPLPRERTIRRSFVPLRNAN